MSARDAAKLRRAALAVYALSPGDRRRLYALLGEAHVERLRPLISELEQLGIPSGAASLKLDEEVEEASPTKSVSVSEDEISLLLSQSQGTIAHVLSDRPNLAQAAGHRLPPVHGEGAEQSGTPIRPGALLRNAITQEFLRQARTSEVCLRSSPAVGAGGSVPPDMNWWQRAKRLWAR